MTNNEPSLPLPYAKGMQSSRLMQIAIVEDHASDREALQACIASSGQLAHLGLYASGEAFLKACGERRFDIAFLDIYLSGKDGLSTARDLRAASRWGKNCAIVFTTSSPEHALEAYGVDAMQYLLKPIDCERVDEILGRCLREIETAQVPTVPIKSRGTLINVPHDDIVLIEADNHNCKVHTIGGLIETGSSMRIDDFAHLLEGQQFLRCHRSYIVNLSHVAKMDGDFIMDDGTKAYIRRGDGPSCEKKWKKWLFTEAIEGLRQ